MNRLLLLAGPGQKLQEAAGAELGSIFLVICVAMSLWFFWQRDFTKFISFALFAMLVGVFVFNPEIIKTFGADGFTWLFEAYLQ